MTDLTANILTVVNIRADAIARYEIVQLAGPPFSGERVRLDQTLQTGITEATILATRGTYRIGDEVSVAASAVNVPRAGIASMGLSHSINWAKVAERLREAANNHPKGIR
jgi:hypothetical protein